MQGSGIPLSQLCLIPSLSLLHKKTKPDPQSPDEKEMEFSLVAQTQGCFCLIGDQVAPAPFFSTAPFLEKDCYDCISPAGAMR